MQVVKVFNNNVVLGADGHGGEFVLLGRGLGFRVSPGMDIDATRVERTFRAERGHHRRPVGRVGR